MNNWKIAEEILKKDGVGILPTDTLYGLVGSIFSKKAVNKIYKIKNRDKNKPLIVLISSIDQLNLFNIKLNEDEFIFLDQVWPNKISVILPCKLKKWEYIHRCKESIAFRMIGPRNKNLFNLIEKVGPLVAPSANKETEKPVETIIQARKYFGGDVDFYINGGLKKSKPSTLITFEKNKIIILRQGEVKLKEKKK